MKKKSMGINAILNAIRTALGIIFPLITFPYVSRILGVDNLGRYNFSHSVVSYAALFAALGVNSYAIRECSKAKKDKQQLNQTASEVFTINLIATILSYLVLIVLCSIIPKFERNKALIYVLSLEIIFSTLGCQWIYSVFEDFLYITLRTLVVYIVSLVLLFVFVHTEEDLLNYTIVSAVSACGASVANMIGRRRYCRIRPVTHCNCKKHLTPIMTIFANQVTTTIYVHSDVLLLGLMTTDTVSGIYTVAMRIYTIIKKILAAVITVSVPRLAAYWGEGDRAKIERTSTSIINTLMIIVVPAMVGLLAISEQVVLLISGSAYRESRISLSILSIALLFSLFCWFFTSCVLIPSKNEKMVLQGTIVAAITNIVLNIILIPKFQEKATAFTTMLAEAVALTFAFIKSRKVLIVHIRKREILSVITGCAAILVICRTVILLTNGSTVPVICIAIPTSVIAYASILILCRNMYALDLLQRAKKLLLKK